PCCMWARGDVLVRRSERIRSTCLIEFNQILILVSFCFQWVFVRSDFGRSFADLAREFHNASSKPAVAELLPVMRYLYGPVLTNSQPDILASRRARDECLYFDTDVRINTKNSWADVLAQLPDGWRPNFIALRVDRPSDPDLWASCPMPLVALAPDWERRWHLFRHLLPLCDLVLTSAAGAERLTAAGLVFVRQTRLPFESAWDDALDIVRGEWESLAERARGRGATSPQPSALCRAWAAIAAGLVPEPPTAAAVEFRAALRGSPGHPIAGLSLAEALYRAGDATGCVAACREALGNLDRSRELSPAFWDLPPYPPPLPSFPVQW